MPARFFADFANGSMALFEATRYARGHKALFTLEINGERASASWDLHDLHRLDYFDHRDEGQLRGWKSIHITDGDHPYMKNWWVPGLQIGYEHTFIHQVRRFPCCAQRESRRGPNLPRWIGDRLCNRRGIEIRKEQDSGKKIAAGLTASLAAVPRRQYGI